MYEKKEHFFGEWRIKEFGFVALYKVDIFLSLGIIARGIRRFTVGK
jgi:hypothetical protein